MKRIIALIVMFLLTFVYLSLSIAELPAKFPKMNSETYVFTSFEKRLKTMRILALPKRDKDVKDLKTSFEGTGTRSSDLFQYHWELRLKMTCRMLPELPGCWVPIPR